MDTAGAFPMNTIEASMMDVGTSTTIDMDKNSKRKVPRRVLHFSDGTLEEYSTDEEDQDDADNKQLQTVNPNSLSWGGWIYHHVSNTGNNALAACDYLGENIAYYLGITSPRYQYEIEEHERDLKEEEEERRKVAEQMAGWNSNSESMVTPSPAMQQSPQHKETKPPLHPLAQAYLLSSSEISLAANMSNGSSSVSGEEQPADTRPQSANSAAQRY